MILPYLCGSGTPSRRGSMIRTRKGLFIRLMLSLVFSSCSVVFGQGGSELTGNVTDPSNAPIPNADITVRNVGTNETRKMTTGPTGVFTITSLTVGTYELKV